MATFHITSPDGAQYEVNAPEGATEQDAINYVQQNQHQLEPIKADAPSAPATPSAAKPAAPEDRGVGRTAFDQGMQGATFGFSDEIQDRIGALIASQYTGESYDDMLKMAREASKKRLSDEMSTRPVLSVGANLAGGLLTGVAGAQTAAGKTVANSLRNGVVLGKDLGKAGIAAKAAATGAAQGALYGAGSAEDGVRGEGALMGAGIGAAAGGAAPYVGSGIARAANYGSSIVKGAVGRAAEELPDVADALKKIAGGNYSAMRKAGAVYNDTAANDLITNINHAVSGNEFIPELNPKTMAIINKITDRATDPKGGGLSLSELDQYRRLLGRIGQTEDGLSAGAARKAIDDFVGASGAQHLASGDPKAVQLLNAGRKQYQQASKFEDVADIITKADGDPGKIKRGLTRYIEQNGNVPPGWSDAEAKALRRAASAGAPEQLLRFVGKAGFDFGGTKMMGNITGGTAGYFLSGNNPVVPIVGTAAKQAYKYGTRGQAADLLKLLEQGTAQNSMLPAFYSAAVPYAGVAQRSLTNATISHVMPGMTAQPNPMQRFY